MKRLLTTLPLFLALLSRPVFAQNGELVVSHDQASLPGNENTRALLTLTPGNDVKVTGLFQQTVKAAIASKAQELGLALSPLQGLKFEGSYGQSGSKGAMVDTTKLSASYTALRGLTLTGSLVNQEKETAADARRYALGMGWSGHLGALTGSMEGSGDGLTDLTTYKLRYSLAGSKRVSVALDAAMTEKGTAGGGSQDVTATGNIRVTW